MRGIKVELLNEEEIEKRGIKSWGIWEKEPSEFDWSYTQAEHCYIITGSAEIKTEEGSVEIKEGDYVIFPVGLKCRWNVKDRIKKYYDFR